jgi:hypothetical protein
MWLTIAVTSAALTALAARRRSDATVSVG